jgi:hypothetical protein
MTLFEETSLVYEDALILSNYREANKFVRNEGTGHQNPDFNHLKNIKVTSYELLEKTPSSDNLEVQLTVEIEYFHADYLRVTTLIDEQQWEYDETDERWYLVSGLPDFR